jgi:hypothetical protein
LTGSVCLCNIEQLKPGNNGKKERKQRKETHFYRSLLDSFSHIDSLKQYIDYEIVV